MDIAVTTNPPEGWAAWVERRNMRTSAEGRTDRQVLRDDLSVLRGYTSQERAKARRTEVRERLWAKGYTVDSRLTVYSLYVIELDPSGISDEFVGYLYVGYTSKNRAERLEQHRLGLRSGGNNRGYSTIAHRLYVRDRDDLTPQRVLFSEESALRAESRLRVRLERRGYKVVGGQERLDVVRRPRP